MIDQFVSNYSTYYYSKFHFQIKVPKKAGRLKKHPVQRPVRCCVLFLPCNTLRAEIFPKTVSFLGREKCPWSHLIINQIP